MVYSSEFEYADQSDHAPHAPLFLPSNDFPNGAQKRLSFGMWLALG